MLRYDAVRGLGQVVHGRTHELESAVETGRSGPVGDIQDLGHLTHGKVEVVVQDHDRPLVDVDAAELVKDPRSLGDVCRRCCVLAAIQTGREAK
jgi:hypothetical protein